jgi:hypothetical protein
VADVEPVRVIVEDPAGQGVQDVCPARSEYVSAPQITHGPPSGPEYPASHWQAVADVEPVRVIVEDPAGQGEQELPENKAVSWYVSAGHAAQVPEFMYSPAAQPRTMHAMLEVDPVTPSVTVPGGHAAHFSRLPSL